MRTTPPSTDTPAIPGLFLSLLQAGLLTHQQITSLAQETLQSQSQAIDVLLTYDYIDEDTLAQFLSKTFAYPLAHLHAFHKAYLSKLAAQALPDLHALPLHTSGNRMTVAISDPTNTELLDQLRFHAQMTIDPVIVSHSSLMLALDNKPVQDLHSYEQIAQKKTKSPAQTDNSSPDQGDNEEDAPVVRFLQQLLLQAIQMGVSDLHFEPYEQAYRVRFRIDGILREVTQPPITIKEKLASRIKVLSELDIAEKRVPQDGRMKLAISKTKSIDFRVSTLPTLFGEKIVMRILDSEQAQVGIDSLGYTATQKQHIIENIHRPYGMVIVTGPTGSGKTVSLYTFLNILNKPGINISSAEDPAEMHMAGINQVNINERAGLTFPTILRAFLRQDPDIIMVGEVRDLETADIAIKAAQTGHLVLTTLHTNDAPATLTRLINMGVPAFNIASSIIMITAQRLVRKLCECREATHLPRETLLEAGFRESELDEGWTPYKAIGCEQCNQSGYKGRVGIHQVMLISPEIERLILTHATTMEIEAQARKEGMLTLREAGLQKVRLGMTTLEEVIGATNQ